MYNNGSYICKIDGKLSLFLTIIIYKVARGSALNPLMNKVCKCWIRKTFKFYPKYFKINALFLKIIAKRVK